MNGNIQTATTNRADLTRRFTAVLTTSTGAETYLDTFFKTEQGARNAAIRARARLRAAGVKVSDIRTVCLSIDIKGKSSPIRQGVYPTDFNGNRDKWMADYF